MIKIIENELTKEHKNIFICLCSHPHAYEESLGFDDDGRIFTLDFDSGYWEAGLYSYKSKVPQSWKSHENKDFLWREIKVCEEQ